MRPQEETRIEKSSSGETAKSLPVLQGQKKLMTMRRLLLPAGLSLLLFVLVNVLFIEPASYSRRWLDEDLVVWNYKWNASMPRANIAALGDSQVMSGILPSEFRRRGQSLVNMGLPSQQPEGLFPLIERLPEGTRLVIIGVSPYFMFKSEVVQSFYTYYRATAPFSLADLRRDRKLAGQNTGDAVYRMLRWMPVLQFRDRLSPILTKARPFEEAELRGVRTELIERTLKEEDGFWTWKARNPRECGAVVSAPGSGFLVFKDRPGSEDALRYALKSIQEKGMRAVLVSIPFSEPWAGLTDPRINDRLHSVMRRFAGSARVVETPDRGEYRGLFHDWTHLDYCGAGKYSAWLYDRLGAEFKKE